MEKFKIGSHPHNLGGDVLRNVVVKLNSNFKEIEENLNSGSVQTKVELIDSGDGTNYLSDNGEYKKIETGALILPDSFTSATYVSAEEYEMLNKAVSENRPIYVWENFAGVDFIKYLSKVIQIVTNPNVYSITYISSKNIMIKLVFTKNKFNENEYLVDRTNQLIIITHDDIEDNLNGSSSPSAVLSANQGKILNQNKVDKISGKGLSTNDFTNTYKTSIDTISTELQNGKLLSSNDYTNGDKTLVGTIQNKVDKVEGKGLSTNDFTNEYKSMLDNIQSTVSTNLMAATEFNLGAVRLSSDFTSNSDGDIYLNKTYGIEWDITISDPACKRIGDMESHRSLPIQSKMKACLLNDDGTVNYYLDPNNWDKKLDGTPSKLDGTDGQVMIEIPEHYRKFEEEGNIRRCYLSGGKVSGFHKVDKVYVSAYEAACDRVNNKLASVVNSSVQYRGGQNFPKFDDGPNSLLGKCATNMTRSEMRTAARARSDDNRWNILDYNTHKTIFWLYYVEYANRNSQLPVNYELDSNGCMQGGLGNGPSTLNLEVWEEFNVLNPVLNCGASNSLGSNSGEVIITLPESFSANGTVTLACNRYRGIENPFGHVQKNIDGLILYQEALSSEDGGNNDIYFTKDYNLFGDDTIDGFTKIGVTTASDGYIADIMFGGNGDIIPIKSSGSSTTYWCDEWILNTRNSKGIKVLRVGGHAGNIGYDIYEKAGLASICTGKLDYSVSQCVGTRLCYLTYDI